MPILRPLCWGQVQPNEASAGNFNAKLGPACHSHLSNKNKELCRLPATLARSAAWPCQCGPRLFLLFCQFMPTHANPSDLRALSWGKPCLPHAKKGWSLVQFLRASASLYLYQLAQDFISRLGISICTCLPRVDWRLLALSLHHFQFTAEMHFYHYFLLHCDKTR